MLFRSLEEPTLKRAVEFAVETEKLGALFYNKMATKMSADAEIQEVFKSLAKDEVIHEKQFTKLLASVPDEQSTSSRYKDRLAMLKLLSRSEFFMGESGFYRELEKIQTKEEALERAFNLEKDTLAYYNGLKEIIGENEILNEIIEEEKKHFMKVGQYLITGAKMRGLRDKF